MQVKFRICDRAVVVVFQHALGCPAVPQRNRSTGAHAYRSRPLREGVVGNGIDTFGTRTRNIGITVVKVIIARAVGVLHFVGARVISVSLGRTAAPQVKNVAIGVVGDGIANTDVPSAVYSVLGNGKLAEVVVGVLHRIIRRFACPVVHEAGGFNAAIVVTGSTTPTGCVSDVFGKTVAIDSQKPTGRVIKVKARFSAVCQRTINEEFTLCFSSLLLQTDKKPPWNQKKCLQCPKCDQLHK